MYSLIFSHPVNVSFEKPWGAWGIMVTDLVLRRRCVDLELSKMYRRFASGRIWNSLFKALKQKDQLDYPVRHCKREMGQPDEKLATYELLKNTFVQSSLGPPALPKLVVLMLKAVPMLAKFFQTIRTYIFKPVQLGQWHWSYPATGQLCSVRA